MYGRQKKTSARLSEQFNNFPSMRSSNTFSSNSYRRDKFDPQSLTHKEIQQNKFILLKDKKILKQILKTLSSQGQFLCQKQQIIGRLVAFAAEIDDIEAQNKRINRLLADCRQEMQDTCEKIKHYMIVIKQKDNNMLQLKGKLYQKDENLRTLNKKLNLIIQAIENTPMEKSSISQVSRFIHEEDSDQQINFSINQSSQLCLKIINLEAQNRKHIQKIKGLQAKQLDRNGQNKSDQFSKMINSLMNDKKDLQHKLMKCLQQNTKLKVNSHDFAKQKTKKDHFSLDQLQQLRTSIKNLEEDLSMKDLYIDKLNKRIVFLDTQLEQSKNLMMQKIQEINSLKMELKLSQDILQVEVESGRITLEKKSVLFKQIVDKLKQQNQSLKEKVEVLHKSLSIASRSQNPSEVQCMSIVYKQNNFQSEVIDFNIDELKLRNMNLQSKIIVFTDQKSNYDKQIMNYKEAVSQLSEEQKTNSMQNLNFGKQIQESRQRKEVEMDSELCRYIRKLKEFEVTAFSTLDSPVQLQKQQQLQSNSDCEVLNSQPLN